MSNIALNQFGMNAIKGQMDLRSGQPTLSCQVDSSASASLIPGQAVKIVDSVGGVPKVIPVAADTDDVFGFVVYDAKTPLFAVGDRVEILPMRCGVMFMESGAAVARNAEVQVVVSGSKVITAVSSKRIVGRALDKATASGQLIRVMVDLPGALKA
jgi:hypothetical protein